MAVLAQENISRCARILAYARQTETPVAGLPAEALPQGEDDAFAIQRETLALVGDAVAGWKCAAPPGKPQSGAALGRAGILQSPAQLKFRADREMGIEAEIALTLAVDLPGRSDGRSYERADIVQAIGGVMPVLELVQSRFVDRQAVSRFESMADSISHFGLVRGEAAPDWRALDLSRLRVVLKFDDAVQVDTVGGNPSGDPLTGVVWLANRLIETGTHLREGEVVTTGSCTGLLFVKPGASVVATFNGLGTVSLDLVAACPFGFG